MKPVIVIPARYGSTRYPGKPLALVAGISLLQRVWRIARQVTPDVFIATDDERVADHAATFNAAVVRTSPQCSNGSERVGEALKKFPAWQKIINLQGDAVLTPPWVLSAMAQAMEQTTDAIVTPAVRLDREGWQSLADSKQETPASGTLVTCRKDGTALYFSKAMIPYVRHSDASAFPPVYRHIGLYGYEREALQRLLALPPSPLEQAEGLEQLRALEHGMSVRVVEVDYRGRSHASIDSPQDVRRVEAIIAREGELVPL